MKVKTAAFPDHVQRVRKTKQQEKPAFLSKKSMEEIILGIRHLRNRLMLYFAGLYSFMGVIKFSPSFSRYPTIKAERN